MHWIEHKFPNHEILVVSRTKDEQLWLVTAVSDTEPGETMLFDRNAHVLTLYKDGRLFARRYRPIHPPSTTSTWP